MSDAPDPRWLELFTVEFGEIAERLEAAGVALCEAWAPASVNEAFRALHTLKGNSYAIGYGPMGDLAHRFERVLDGARDGAGAAMVPAVGELLLEVTDTLRAMLANPGIGASPALVERIDALAPAATTSPPPAAAPEPRPAEPPPRPSRETLVIPVDVADLDRLVAATEALRALAQNSGDDAIVRHAEDLSRDLLGIRRVGVGKIAPRLRRLVRDTARALAKTVDLRLIGEELEADASVVRDLTDALPHLLRNALDHGLESPGHRLSVGKPAEGRVTIRFTQQSSAFIVEVEDDGRGMDPDAILESALRKGLLTEDEGARLGREERLRLIFQPGFSTREQATELSGRGVGMDVVADVVERHRGRIDIDTRKGAGTRFRLRFPVLFRYEEYLVTEMDHRPVGLPVRYVAEIIERDDAPLVEDGLVVLRGEALAVIGFREMDPRFGDPVRRALCVLGFETGRVALAVDRLIGFAGTLIQPLPDRGIPEYLAGVGQAPDGRQLWGLDLDRVGRTVERYRVEGWGHGA